MSSRPKHFPPSPSTRAHEALFEAERAASRQIADYIAEVAVELQEMAEGARLTLLAQLLAMARLEADIQARRDEDET